MKNTKGSTLTIVLAVVAVALAAGLGYVWYSNNKVILELNKRYTETQSELTKVKSEAQEAREEVKAAASDVSTPLGRLALLRAFTAKAEKVLSKAGKDNLDTVIVYIEKQPEVLLEKNPQLPADVRQAVTELKKELQQVKIKASAVQSTSDEAKVGTTVTLEGTLDFIQSDAVMGGGVFSLVDDETGAKYFFYFAPATSTNLQQTMVGKTVTVDVLITNAAKGMVTYDVVSGPTLVTSTPSPTP